MTLYGACTGEVPGQLYPARPGQAQGRRQVQRRKGKNETQPNQSNIYNNNKRNKTIVFFLPSPFWKLYTPVKEKIFLECLSLRNTSVSSSNQRIMNPREKALHIFWYETAGNQKGYLGAEQSVVRGGEGPEHAPAFPDAGGQPRQGQGYRS